MINFIILKINKLILLVVQVATTKHNDNCNLELSMILILK